MTSSIRFLFQYFEKEEISIDQTEFEFQIQSHPDYPSLLSITDTLSFFKINNLATNLQNEDLLHLPKYFIALIQDDKLLSSLVFVEKTTKGYKYLDNNTVIECNEETFLKSFQNVVLLVEKEESEPKKEKQSNGLVIFGSILFGLLYLTLTFINGFSTLPSIFICLALTGIYLSYGAISSEFDLKKLNYLQANKNYKSLLSTISQLKSSLIDNSRNSKNTIINGTKETVNLERNQLESFYQLKKVVKDWNLNYVFRTSIDGRVSFLQLWSGNQNVNAGDNVFTIIPTKEKGFIGKVKAEALNSGKIKVGQKVNIRLTNFPDREFGVLNGIIKNIALTPDNDNNLLIDVALPNGLATSYKKQIVFQQEMSGSAEIVTEDLRLIERLLYQFRDIFKR